MGRIPCNSDFQSTENEVLIAVVHNGIHSEIVVPLVSQEMDWKAFLFAEKDSALAKHTFGIIGWGNRRFYLETAHWEDLDPLLALEAMAGIGETTVHVECIDWLPSGDAARQLKISRKQYAQLCESMKRSFRIEGKQAIRIPNAAYGHRDAFFEGEGHYHLFRNCNVWTGNQLRESGIRVGYWTPFPSSVFASLPE